MDKGTLVGNVTVVRVDCVLGVSYAANMLVMKPVFS